MKIREASDLHLEFRYWEFPPLPEDKDTVCVLAGDIIVAGKSPNSAFIGFLHDTAEQFKDVIYIMGNHDHWRSSIVRTIPKIKRAMVAKYGEVPANLHIVNDETVVIDDVAFICATLWTDYGKSDPFMMYVAEHGNAFSTGMRDFKKIRYGSEGDPYKLKLRPVHTVAMHMRSKEYIFPEIAAQKALGRKTVVVSHHAPSVQSMVEEWRTDELFGAYATELGWEIADAEPTIWFHGHIHDSADYMIHTTRILCNPRGYAPDMLNPNFKSEFVLEL